MKIVLTTSMAGLGGTETATVRLGRLLRQHGHDIMLASSDGPLLKEAQALGIRWQPVDFYRGGLFGYLKGMIAYARMLRREQPDIIDCQMARVVPACAIAAKIVSPKTKIIYHSHGLDAATYPKIAKLFDKLGVYIIGNCKHEREKLIRHGFPADRIVYAYNALPPRFRSKTTRLFYLGTLSYSYDVETVCKGVRKLLDDGENVELHIMGGGPDLEKLKQYENRAIKFYGYLPYSEMMSIAKGCDIAVNAIHSHAMQSVTNKLSDYMALQKPILNSQTNAEVLSLLNLLPHENYRSGDVDSFVQAAKDILKRKNDPVQSDEIVRRFRRDISYRKIVNLIERLANE